MQNGPLLSPPLPPRSLFLSKRSLFLRWQRVWQKPAEAATWCCFSVLPPFYAFLIFKAIIGLSDKILSNQILSFNLVLWLPSGRKSWWGLHWLCGGVGGVLFERSPCQSGGCRDPPPMPHPLPPPTPQSNIYPKPSWTDSVADPPKTDQGKFPEPNPVLWGWIISPPFC